jgi:hypothetical protein
MIGCAPGRGGRISEGRGSTGGALSEMAEACVRCGVGGSCGFRNRRPRRGETQDIDKGSLTTCGASFRPYQELQDGGAGQDLESEAGPSGFAVPGNSRGGWDVCP